MDKPNKLNSRLFNTIILSLLVVILVVVYFLTYKYYVKNLKYTFELKTDEINVKLNESINPEKFIKKRKNVSVLIINVSTNTIGKRYITYNVTDNFDHRHYYYLTVNVIDDIAPTVEGKNKISLYTGTKVDLKSYISVKDNYDKNLNIDVNGDVDTSKEGTYKVDYIVTDKSGNKATHSIEFTVKKKEVYEAPSVDNGVVGTTSKGYKIENKGGATYIKGILVANKTYNLSKTYGSGLTSSTKNAFNEMQAAAKLDGFDLYIGSGYRSYNTQKNTYNRYVKRDGKAKADTYSARPGHSEHQTGLAIDICARGGYKCIGSGFDGTAPANWLSDNAYKYGFILRYPKGKTNETGYKFESWHFRYVGKDLAKELYNGGNWITLESYLGITSKYNE